MTSHNLLLIMLPDKYLSVKIRIPQKTITFFVQLYNSFSISGDFAIDFPLFLPL